MFIGRTDAEAETLILWPPDVKHWLIGKDPDAGKIMHSESMRNISNLRYAHDTTRRAEREEELKSLLMKVKEESKNLASSSTFRK